MAAFSADPETSLNRIIEINPRSYSDSLVASYELDTCVEWIKTNNYSKVCLQFPDSSLLDSVEVALHIVKQTSRKVFILGDTSYGSCCVDEVAAQHVSGDSIIHFGHACLSPVTLSSVLYVLPKATLNVTKFYNELKTIDLSGPVLILYDVSFTHLLDELKNLVPEELRNNVIIPELNTGPHNNPCSPDCQLLGDIKVHHSVNLGRAYCEPHNEKISLIVYIGNKGPTLDNFLFTFKEPSFKCYSDANGFEEVFRTNVMAKCSYLVERIKDANNIGILVGTLGIKGYLKAIEQVKQLCNRGNKKTYIIAVGKPNPAKLANFPEMDVFVAICCPEAEFGDKKDYIQPIVGLFEIELAFNKNRSWTDVCSRDFRDLIAGGKNYIPCPDDEMDSTLSVSLVSNKLQGVQSECTTESKELVSKQDMPVALQDQSSFQRTWNGLEQSLGETEIQLATKGRSGIPVGYNNEKQTD